MLEVPVLKLPTFKLLLRMTRGTVSEVLATLFEQSLLSERN